MTSPSDIGEPTLQTRVESWECGFNGHWNARFDGRGFQHAAEVIACRAGGLNPGGLAVKAGNIRFHSAAVSGDPVQVRTAAISSGTYRGAVMHLLFCSGRLASTVLDLLGLGAAKLPKTNPDYVSMAPTRILSRATQIRPWSRDAVAATLVETGPVRPLHLRHAGHPLFEEIIGRSATAVHDLMDRPGFTLDFMKRENITRMAVETRVCDIGAWTIGTTLRVRSQLTAISAKTYRTAHDIVTPEDELVDRVEYNFLGVDTKARRATAVPKFLMALSDEIRAK